MLHFNTHGKWILAGEHTVLRGGTAIVFPVESRSLDFQFIPKAQGQELIIENDHQDLRLAFWKVFNVAMERLNLKAEDLPGVIHLSSDIPVGAGMGASATLCVSLARLFSSLNFLKIEEEFQFAQGLENIFHGESSGVDVAVALHNKPLLFQRNKPLQFFQPQWKPNFYLSYCGEKGMTSVCVEKVQKLFVNDPERAEEIDQMMKEAVSMALAAFETPGDTQKMTLSLEMAAECFQRWEIIGPQLQSHINWLKRKGALAVKPTGSGWGGFVLSLWPDSLTFDRELSEILIKA